MKSLLDLILYTNTFLEKEKKIQNKKMKEKNESNPTTVGPLVVKTETQGGISEASLSDVLGVFA